MNKGDLVTYYKSKREALHERETYMKAIQYNWPIMNKCNLKTKRFLTIKNVKSSNSLSVELVGSKNPGTFF